MSTGASRAKMVGTAGDGGQLLRGPAINSGARRPGRGRGDRQLHPRRVPAGAGLRAAVDLTAEGRRLAAMADKRWITKKMRRLSPEHLKGVEGFMQHVRTVFAEGVQILCPCTSCINRNTYLKEEWKIICF